MPELTEITETPIKVEESAARIEDDDDDSDDTIPELEDTGKLIWMNLLLQRWQQNRKKWKKLQFQMCFYFSSTKTKKNR